MSKTVIREAISAESKPVAPRYFAHAVFRTPNYQAMIDWYGKVLNAHVVAGGPLLTFMSFDEEHHRLAFINQPKLKPADGSQAGIEHLAYSLGDLAELLNCYARLKSCDIAPVWCVNHGMTISMYFQDPDGNRVELQVDNFDTVEELQGWFNSAEFAENPIGHSYDPEELLRLYANGTPRSELIRIGFAA